MAEQPAPATCIIGDYTVTTWPHLGKGAFAMVYKAVHREKPEEDVAVKEIMHDTDEMRCMAARELQLLRRLRHDNIVKVIDHVTGRTSFWIFMEYCDLKNLKMYLQQKKEIDLVAKIKIMQQTASAIAFMHTQDPAIIHRDIKLENILMKREGNQDIVKVTDFGMSKLYEERLIASLSTVFRSKKEMNTLCGTPSYMAPEFWAELESGLKFTAAVDVFALGLVFAVVITFGPDKNDCVPLSVESRKNNHFVEIGKEMIENHRNRKSLPKAVEYEYTDGKVTHRVKRIIFNMTKFRSIERKNITEVDEEMTEIEDQLSEQPVKETKLSRVLRNRLRKPDLERFNTDDVSALKEEIESLRSDKRDLKSILKKKEETLENVKQENASLKSEMEEMTSQPISQNDQESAEVLKRKIRDLRAERKEIKATLQSMGDLEEDMARELTILRETNKRLLQEQSIKDRQIEELRRIRQGDKQTDEQERPKPTPRPRRQKREWSGKESISLQDLPSTLYSTRKEANLSGWPHCIKEINGEIWCCQGDGISVFNDVALTKLRHVLAGDMGYTRGMADVGDSVVVASQNGLYLLSHTGERERIITRGKFYGIYFHDSHVFAACEDDSRVHVYETRNWQKKTDINTPCDGGHRHTLVVNSSEIILACYNDNCIYTLSHSGQLLNKEGKKGDKVTFKSPYICQIDSNNMLLIAHLGNDRLQLRDVTKEWHVVQLKPQPNKPISAVYKSDALFVASAPKIGTKKLFRYEV